MNKAVTTKRDCMLKTGVCSLWHSRGFCIHLFALSPTGTSDWCVDHFGNELITLGESRGPSREQLVNLLALELRKVGTQDFQATQTATTRGDKFDWVNFRCNFLSIGPRRSENRNGKAAAASPAIVQFVPCQTGVSCLASCLRSIAEIADMIRQFTSCCLINKGYVTNLPHAHNMQQVWAQSTTVDWNGWWAQSKHIS